MYCTKCGIQNEDDALFCKRCGASLIEEYQNEVEKKQSSKKERPQKVKTKTKVKKKGKRIKAHSRYGNRKKQVRRERKRGLFSKVIIVFLCLVLFLLVGICGFFGYKLYSNKNIEVPNVLTMTYEEAESTLTGKGLNVEKREKVVEEEEQSNIVLTQSKKAGKRVSKNTVIMVTVGVLDSSIIVPDLVGMNIDQGKNTLNHLHIFYTVSYQEIEEGEDNIILKQTPKKNNKIEKGESVELIVSKKVKSDSDLLTETEEKEDTMEKE